MDKDSALLIAWLQKQPADAMIDWASDQLSAERPWAGSWVDVLVPAIQDEHAFNWCWTVHTDHSDFNEPDELWNFFFEHDLDVYGVFDPEPPNCWYISEISLPRGSLLAPEQDAELNRVAIEGPNRKRTMCGAWSADAISRALEGWSARYARRPDLRFKWSPEIGSSDMVQEAVAQIAKIQAGEIRGYDLGGGLRATPEFMDTLINKMAPEDAAATMKAARRIVGPPE